MLTVNVPLNPESRGREAEALHFSLSSRIVGQNEAVQQIVSIYQTYLTGMNSPGRPISNFLFLGPTGTGKTPIVEATAEALLKNPRALTKIDCAEFQHSHEIAKLIGSPPGYLGHRETHPLLSQEVLNQYHTATCKLSLVLFDEIEKASDALWNLLLGILDKASLTLGDNRKVDFSRALIFMTSNLGSVQINTLLSSGFGFPNPHSRDGSPDQDDKLAGKIARSGTKAARRLFSGEFINRLDKIVSFKPLGQEELRKILDIELEMVQQRIFRCGPANWFKIALEAEAKEFLLTEGIDARYGARHLKRSIERFLVQPLSNLIATGQIRGGDAVSVDFDNETGKLLFTKVWEGLPYASLTPMTEFAEPVPLLSKIKSVPLPASAKTSAASVAGNFTDWPGLW